MVANAGRWVARLEAAGMPVVDAVRATLIAYADGEGPSFDHQTTHAWPLSSDPTSLARSESEAYERVLESSTVIPMPDAEALRVLRRAVRDEASALNGGYVPIVTESGARFGLYVSDVLPFEGDDGRVVF